ncbi:Auxin response factor 8 [Acorus gramineus]|uniref:Auxin response factor 8 n=1 Tax=Acorus gramineus TaxID=55184 RepID=A0AAV9AH28_ACOGR|nr:Auxin response factor 8 [Acorus gramineus]
MPTSVPLHLWKASVGNACTYIPRVDDKVFYFPAGHSELSSSPIDIASEEPPVSVATASTIHCQIVEVQLLADNDTDEAFYRILLQPCPYRGPIFKPSSAVTPPPPPSTMSLSWFSKVLTQSDAHNGGGYSIPRACAESLFPPLNYADDTPLQTLSVTDMHGTVWEFRHIFRGNPKRHLLTTGWSRFVTGKSLTKEDSVVFMKVGVEEELFVGIRRRRRMGELRGRGEVVNAMRKAWAGETFEVTYYPRKGTLEFIVGVDAVERVLRERWAPGVRVKMAVEMEDSRKIWVHGFFIV